MFSDVFRYGVCVPFSRVSSRMFPVCAPPGMLRTELIKVQIILSQPPTMLSEPHANFPGFIPTLFSSPDVWNLLNIPFMFFIPKNLTFVSPENRTKPSIIIL